LQFRHSRRRDPLSLGLAMGCQTGNQSQCVHGRIMRLTGGVPPWSIAMPPTPVCTPPNESRHSDRFVCICWSFQWQSGTAVDPSRVCCCRHRRHVRLPRRGHVGLMRWPPGMLHGRHVPAMGARCPAFDSVRGERPAGPRTIRWCTEGRALFSARTWCRS